LRALAEPELNGVPMMFMIIGAGPQRSHLASLAGALGLNDRVMFHDAVEHNELPEFYAAIDAGVFPSTGDEAFGISIAEAMSCGKPVIGSHVGGIPEVVGNEGSCGILVAPGDSRALAQAMRRLALDPGLRASMGRAARERVVRQFTWDACARRLLSGLQL
jgi:glycosyltransferase involved in cell wall biosynthesis